MSIVFFFPKNICAICLFWNVVSSLFLRFVGCGGHLYSSINCPSFSKVDIHPNLKITCPDVKNIRSKDSSIGPFSLLLQSIRSWVI